MAEDQARPKDGGEIPGWAREAIEELLNLLALASEGKQGDDELAGVIVKHATSLLSENAALSEEVERLKGDVEQLRIQINQAHENMRKIAEETDNG